MNRCLAGALTASVITGLLMSLVVPSTTPDSELVKANKELTAQLTAKNEKAEQAFEAAAKALDDAKKNLSCPK